MWWRAARAVPQRDGDQYRLPTALPPSPSLNIRGKSFHAPPLGGDYLRLVCGDCMDVRLSRRTPLSQSRGDPGRNRVSVHDQGSFW